MRSRIAFAAVLLAGGAAVPAAASATPVTLRIVGRSTGWVDILLTAPTSFDEGTARLKTSGSYVAWWLARRGEVVTPGSNQAGNLRWARDTGGRPVDDLVVDFGMRRGPLDPGAYRLYLATDGPSVVEVRATGLGRSRTVAPTRRAASGAGREGYAVLAGGVVNGQHRRRVELPGGALAVSSAMTRSAPGVTARQLTACVTRPGADCDGMTTTSGYTSSIYDEHVVQLNAMYNPQHTAGTVEFVRQVTAGPGVVDAAGSWFWLTPVP